MASSNIASQPDAGAMSFGQVALGELPVFNNSIGPLQAAMDEVFEGDPASPVARLYFPGIEETNALETCEETLLAGQPCLWVTRIGPLAWLPSLLTSNLGPGSLTTTPRPLDVDLGLLAELLPGARLDVHFLGGPRVERRRSWDRWGPRSNSVGLWLNFEVRIFEGLSDVPYPDIDIQCDCFGADTPGFEAICQRLETGNSGPFHMPPATADAFEPGLCFPLPIAGFPVGEGLQLTSFGAKVRLRRIPLSLGFIPVRRDPSHVPTPNAAWLAAFPGSRDLRLDELFDVEVVLGNELSFDSVGGNAAALDASTADLAFATGVSYVSQSFPWCELLDCEGLVGQEVLLPRLAQELYGALAGPALAGGAPPLADRLLGLVDFGGTAQDLSAPGLPCDLTSTCLEPSDAPVLEDLIAATISFHRWHWLASPFVPEHEEYFFPMLQIRTNDAALPDNHVVRPNVGPMPAALLHGSHGEAETLLFDFDEDPDLDGVLTPVDGAWTCPDVGLDSDNDGLSDACDPCPYATENDVDGDGVCAFGLGGTPLDNCPFKHNPTQANCNVHAERALTPTQLWGDACDPVPCPDELYDPVLEQKVELALGTLHCSRWERRYVELRPLASHDVGPGPAEPVADVPTQVLFCQRNPLNGIECDEAYDHEPAARARDARCAPDLPSSLEPACLDPVSGAPAHETADHHFHRITLQDETVSPPLTITPNDVLTMDYDRDAEASVAATDWARRLRWLSTLDKVRWKTSGLATIQDEPKLAQGVPGAALKGALLTFADTLVGSPLGQSPQDTHGLDADDLISGHYELGHAPVEVLCQPGVGLYDFDVGKALVFRKIPNFDDGDPLEPSARPGWAELVTLVGTRPAVVRPDGVALFVDDRLGPVLRARLQQPGLRWVQRAEASPLQGGAELDFPLAVALELDGSDIVDAATLKNGKLLADADRGFERVDVVGSPHADDFVGVLSGARRGLFVVGGQRPGTSTPTGEIWFTGLSTSRWILLRTGFRPARALAATFSYATDELYVLDELDDQLRLTAIEQATWRSRELARWQHAPEFDAHHLTLELDGGLLLSASSSTLRLHSYARLRPSSGPHELLLEGFGVGVGALASAPIIDANGVSFVLETLVTPSGKPIPGKPKAPHALGRGVALERVRELSLLDGSIEDLEGLL